MTALMMAKGAAGAAVAAAGAAACFLAGRRSAGRPFRNRPDGSGDHRLVMHVPLKAWDGGAMNDLDWRDPVDDLLRRISGAGASGCYSVRAEGHYMGRSYPELLIVACCRDGQAMAGTVWSWARDHAGDLRQEAYACELDGGLLVRAADDLPGDGGT